MINLDMSNVSELKRITKLEMEGCIDEEGLKEFTKAKIHTSYMLSSMKNFYQIEKVFNRVSRKHATSNVHRPTQVPT